MLRGSLRRTFSAIKPNYLHFDNKQPNNLVVCHGLMGSHKNFRNICRNPLVTCHANCYLLDARNHGDSPHTPTHSVQELADDVAQFIIDNNLNKVTLMGHSMGGLSLMAFSKYFTSMQHIVDNIIIIDMSNSPGAAGNETKHMLSLLNKMSLKGKPIEQIYHELDTLPVHKDIIGLLKTNIAPSKVDPTDHIWKSNIRALYEHYDELVGFYLPQMTGWTNPVDIIYGARSDYVDAESVQSFKQVYRNLHESNIHQIENAGHWLHFQKPKQFLAKLDLIFRREGK